MVANHCQPLTRAQQCTTTTAQLLAGIRKTVVTMCQHADSMIFDLPLLSSTFMLWYCVSTNANIVKLFDIWYRNLSSFLSPTAITKL